LSPGSSWAAATPPHPLGRRVNISAILEYGKPTGAYWLLAIDVFETGENLPSLTSGRAECTYPDATEDWRTSVVWGHTLLRLAGALAARRALTNKGPDSPSPSPDPHDTPYYDAASEPAWPPNSPFATIAARRLPWTCPSSPASKSSAASVPPSAQEACGVVSQMARGEGVGRCVPRLTFYIINSHSHRYRLQLSLSRHRLPRLCQTRTPTFRVISTTAFLLRMVSVLLYLFIIIHYYLSRSRTIGAARRQRARTSKAASQASSS
jgi:hypothetical protein